MPKALGQLPRRHLLAVVIRAFAELRERAPSLVAIGRLDFVTFSPTSHTSRVLPLILAVRHGASQAPHLPAFATRTASCSFQQFIFN